MSYLSIIIPVYNAENYIERCIKSICNQSFDDWELLLINDGSRDKSRKICEAFAKKDQRIKVYSKKNGGAASARNYGLNVAQGEYVTFVDSDDYIESGMYQNMLEIAGKYDCDVVMCDCIKEMYGTSSPFSHPIRKGFYNYDQLLAEYYPQLLMPNYMEYPPTISNWLLVIKRKIIEENHISYPENIRFSEDLFFGSLVMSHAKSFYYMKGENYYHYVMNEGSVTHSLSEEKWEIFLSLYKKIKYTFMKIEQYDFSNQIARCLLFFLYHSVNEVLAMNISYAEYRFKMKKMLEDVKREKIFRNIKIHSLKISAKLKILTFFYKYRIGYSLLYFYKYCKKK